MNFHGGDIYNLNKNITDFSSNINPLGVPETFKRLLGENINIFTHYPDIEYISLRESITKYLSIKSIDYVVAGNGAVEIIYKAVETLNIKEVVIAAPTFSEYRRAAILKGVSYTEINAYDETDGTFIVDRVLGELKSDSLYIICNPNNPTGTITDTEVISNIASALKEVNSYLLLDEAFIEFSDDYPNTSIVSKIEDFSNVIVIRAATKFFGMPGIRLGYGISSNKVLVRKIRDRLDPWNVNSAAVLAASCIFEDHSYISNSRKWISKERTFLYRELSSLKGLFIYPSKANFFLVKILDNSLTAMDLKERMIDKGILIRTFEGFTHLGSNHIRVAVKDRISNEILINALSSCI